MDVDRQRSLLPHYVAIVVSVVVVLVGLRAVFGPLQTWINVLAVVVVVLSYPSVVRALGVEPDVWEER